MKTKLLALCAFLFVAGCTTVDHPGTTTNNQQSLANAVEDTLSIGLVPVLTKNQTYLQSAIGVAAALGSFGGSTLTPEDVNAFLAKTKLAPEDQKVVAGLVNSAWQVYVKRYQQTLGANLRPDVKLFLNAVAQGIVNAVVAVPGS